MSINDTHMLSPAGPVSLETFDGETPCEADDDCSELSSNARIAAISLIMPRLRAAMDMLEGPRGHANGFGGGVLEMLSDNIALLQENFMRTLYIKLQRLGVDISSKLTLRLNDEVRLVLAGKHPDERLIRDMLSSDNALVETFVEIATQSAALRDLRNLCALTLCDHASNAYSALAAGPGECIYQISLKGEMNHFYFTR